MSWWLLTMAYDEQKMGAFGDGSPVADEETRRREEWEKMQAATSSFIADLSQEATSAFAVAATLSGDGWTICASTMACTMSAPRSCSMPTMTDPDFHQYHPAQDAGMARAPGRYAVPQR
jgi:hypothetical protein